MSDIQPNAGFGTDIIAKGQAATLKCSVLKRIDSIKDYRKRVLKQQGAIGKGFVASIIISALGIASGAFFEPSLAIKITSVQTWYANAFQFPWLGAILVSSCAYLTYSMYKALKTELLILGILGLTLASASEFVIYQNDVKLPPSNIVSVLGYSPPVHHPLPKTVINGELAALHYDYKTHNKEIVNTIALAEKMATSLKAPAGKPALSNSWFYKMDMAAYGKAVHKQAINYEQNTKTWESFFINVENMDQDTLLLLYVLYVGYTVTAELQKRNIRRAENMLISELDSED